MSSAYFAGFFEFANFAKFAKLSGPRLPLEGWRGVCVVAGRGKAGIKLLTFVVFRVNSEPAESFR